MISDRLRTAFSIRETWESSEEGTVFFRNTSVRAELVASFVLNFISFGILFWWLMRGSEGSVVLHYNAYFGIDIVGTAGQALFIPSAAVGIVLVNMLLARRFYLRRERMLSHILLFSGLFVSLASLVAVLSLSLINS